MNCEIMDYINYHVIISFIFTYFIILLPVLSSYHRLSSRNLFERLVRNYFKFMNNIFIINKLMRVMNSL